jgi:para-nitrobenzyl esterase
MGNLELNKVFAWTEDDFKVSKTMQQYFVNFIKTGNPNGKNLPSWPATKTSKPAPVMHINVKSEALKDKTENRFRVLERMAKD